MTFEEWWKKEAGVKNNGVVKSYIWKEDAKLVWNAAITSSMTLLESGDYYWPSVNPTGPDRQPDRASFAEDELKKLLTS